ncbi:MAG TPA: TRAP transporter substrate-binding protein [Quisquiliibacterium sp.]|nr:MAG: TRAP transporter substrate-binding protein [Burkholderiaceae bacterium]HPA89107.1 TRAP transporter substrate-binding protein [Quisquiliibacterium sp.]HQN13957.1 TRAP transporter substrate-binding protein [Quisquiliibacterium sp.]HQP67625.1 TRAP transporter substrate-binding protein [Quisquiliibacterium sp.]
MRTTIATLLGTLAATVGLAAATPALAQSKHVIKIGWVTPDSPQDPYATGARTFKQAVERQSNGRIEVQLFPNRQLGDEKPMLEGLRFGTVDAAVITNAVIAQIEPAFQVNDLPFLYANEAQAHKVLDGKVGQALAKKLEAKGVIALGFMEGGFRHMINNVRPVTKPEDVKGVKYRVMQNPVFIDMFSSLGGNAVPMAWGETFTAVQQGTIDGLEIPIAVIDSSKFNEVTKFLSLTNHTYSMIGLLISKKSLEKLPPDLQAAVREAGRTAVGAQRQAAAANARQLVDALAKKGMKVNPVGDVAPFRASVKPVYDKFRASIGADTMNEVMAAVK